MVDTRLLVLLALAHGPKHGYEIAKHLEERTGGVCTISFGALYPVLHKLEADKLAAARWVERKKIYALTRAGTKALADGRAELDRLVLAVQRLAS